MRERIDRLQAKINASGIYDIKFSRDPEKWNVLTAEQRAEEICHLLEAHFDGKMRPLPPIGDSRRDILAP